MSVTSAERRELITSLAAFKENVKEVKERFYNFLVTYDPKGYASFNLEAYPGGHPVSVDVLDLQLTEEENLYFEKTFEDSSEFPVYMIIPDAYLDAPDEWEENVRTELAYDLEMATRAVEYMFDLDADCIRFRTERSSVGFKKPYVNIRIENDSIPSSKWIIFTHLTPLNPAILSVNRSTGAVFEDSAFSNFFTTPEYENKAFRGYCIDEK